MANQHFQLDKVASAYSTLSPISKPRTDYELFVSLYDTSDTVPDRTNPWFLLETTNKEGDKPDILAS